MTEVGNRITLAVVLVAIAATFAPVLGYGFVDWDDPAYVTENPAVIGPAASVNVAERLLTPTLGYPVPVTVATFGIEHAFFGLRPAVYHATNLALHLAVCALLFVLARRLGVGATSAALAVALFGLHPAVAEPVSWVTGRKELLAAVFSLAATLEFLRDPPSVGARRWAPALLFLLAALSKPTAVFLVPFLFACQIFLRRERASRAALDVLPLAAGGVVVFAVSLLGERGVHTVRDVSGGGDVLRGAWYAFGFHLGLVFGLQTPCVKHLPTSVSPPFEPAVDLLPLAVLIAVFVGYRALDARRRPAYLVALAWALLAYLPYSNLLPLGRYLADSYVYLPLAGLALACGVVFDRIEWAAARPAFKWSSAAAFGTAVLALAVASRGASLHWKDDVALWGQAYARYPDDYRLCRNLGNGYVNAGKPETALELYESCAARTAREPFRKNIAIALFLTGRRDEARRAWLEIAAKTPEDPVVRRYLQALGVVLPP